MEEGRSVGQGVFYYLGGFFAVIGSIGLIVLVGLTFAGVFWRYVLNAPIFGLIDVSTMLSAFVVACSVAWAAYQGAHIKIELIEQHFSAAVLNWLQRGINFLSASIFGIAAYALIIKSDCGFACGDITQNLAIEHRPFYWALAASMSYCAFLSLWFALRKKTNQLSNEG